MPRTRDELIPFARELRKVMAERDIGPTALAPRLGVSRGAVSNWRSATAAPTLDHARKLATELGVAPERFLALLGGDDTDRADDLAAEPKARWDGEPIDDLSPEALAAIRMIIEGDRARRGRP